MRLYAGPAAPLDAVPQRQAAVFENEASRFWDLFYGRNADRFFKDRHYFDKEWPQLLQAAPAPPPQQQQQQQAQAQEGAGGQCQQQHRAGLTILEVGCGAGNSVFPLLELNKAAYVYACDFSPRAVQLVQAHPEYGASGRVTAFVADITQDAGPGRLAAQLPGPCVDFCCMVFVLSAVAPQHMRAALRNVASVLKRDGGRVLFRDYAAGDMAQARLQDRPVGLRRIRGSFFARGDGTCSYFFDEDELAALFACEGFVCEASTVHARIIENRKSGVRMPRRWVQAVFRYDPPAAASQQQQQCGALKAPAAAYLWLNPTPRADGSAAGPATPALAAADHASSISISSSLAAHAVTCAGQSWQLPAGSSSSSGAAAAAAEQFAALVSAGKLSVLGQCVLILPPWLRLQQQPAVEGAAPTCCCCSEAAWAAGGGAAAAAVQQGVAAALVAVVATLLGARPAVVLLPGTGLQQQQQQHDVLACAGYEAAVQATLALNECRVVAERIKLRRWARGSERHAAALQRELLCDVLPAAVPCRGLVVVGHACCSCAAPAGACQALDAEATEQQRVLTAIWAGAQQRQVMLVAAL